MATLQQLETALKNADAAGDSDAARKLAAEIVKRRSAEAAGTDVSAMTEQERADITAEIPVDIPGVYAAPAEPPPRFDPTTKEQIVGAGEASAAMISGMTTGTVALLGQTLKGLSEQILSGEFGTKEAGDLVEKASIESAKRWTIEPETEAGIRYTRKVGETLGEIFPPFFPMIGATTSQLARGTRAPVVAPAAAAAAEGGQAAVRAARAASTAARAARAPSTSVGAAETPVSIQRLTTAEQMPVPFAGESGLTAGQASRDFAQLQFEKETAKLAETGAPLRERVENQTAAMIQNFDAMVDKLEPISLDKRDVGVAVDQALVNKANVVKKRIRSAYKKAEEAGAMAAPVDMDILANRFDSLQKFEGLVPTISSIKKEAQRLGAISVGDDGAISPGTVSIADAELLRQFVNDATDWSNKRESMAAKMINSAIDETTEGAGGDLYRDARKLRTQYANEFENVGLTAKLLGTKRGTSERQIAFADVFDKVIVLSSVDEMNKLRSTLLKAGPNGKQAWNDLKASGIEYIKSSALSPSQKDAAGNPLLSPDKLNRVIRKLDDQGKLESLYGKKQAQVLRDLAELSTVIYTAPPGAINTSNTASALQVALDSVATFAVTGIPAPVATTLTEASKYMKSKKVKERIQKSLNPRREK